MRRGRKVKQQDNAATYITDRGAIRAATRFNGSKVRISGPLALGARGLRCPPGGPRWAPGVAPITVRGGGYPGGMDTSATVTLGIGSDKHGEKLPTWRGRRLNAVLHAGDIYDAPRLVMPGERIILLTHYPPRVMELVGRGKPATWSYQRVGELAEALRPIASVFGHQHDWFGRQWRRADGTLLVSPGPRGGVLTISANGETTFTPHDAQIS